MTDLEPPRLLTDEEVAFFSANGWVKINGLLTKETAGALLERLKTRMGDAAEREHNPSTEGTAAVSLWSRFDLLSSEDEAFRAVSLSPEMGEIGRRLLNRPVRFWIDTAMVKRPADGAGTGDDATPWHQDYPDRPLDRSAGVNVWIALDSVPPERGAMRFLSGSHRAGVLGSTFREGVDLVGCYPELAEEFEVSPELSYQPGDATIHHALTVHAADANTTAEPRWAYVNVLIDADAAYTGRKEWVTEGVDGIELNRPLDNPRFPVLS